MVNYELGKIYKIVCNETGLIYIGSTAQKYISTRLEGHKRSFKQYLNGKYRYVTSFKIIEGGNFDIILLENHSCKDKYELKARERHYIETMECVNKVIPNRTIKEYYLDNKETLNETTKLYYKDNKETIQEQNKQYYKKNRDKRIEQVKQYYSTNKESIKEQNKQYRETNKEKIQEHSRQYYLDNKDKIKEQKKQYYLNNKETIKEKKKEQSRQYYLKKKAEKQEVITTK